MLEARIHAPDSNTAVVMCAMHGVPGWLYAHDDCPCPFIHVEVHCEDEEEAIEAFVEWAHDARNVSLVDVHHLPS